VRAVIGGELWGVCHGDLAVRGWIAHGGFEAPPVDEEGEAMAAAEDSASALELQGEVAARETVRRFQCGGEGEAAFFMGEEAEEGSVAAVAGAEAADEGGGGHEAAPALADEGGAGQGGRRRGEAEEDI